MPGDASGGGSPGEEEVREGLQRLDRVLEQRVRLALCVLLSRYDRLSFPRLKKLTGETDGNLGAHLRRLEDEGYVRVRKEFADRKPVTWYALTAAGRQALERHLEAVAALIQRAELGS